MSSRANDQSSHRRVQLELNQVNGLSSDDIAAAGATEEGRIGTNFYVQCNEAKKEPEVSNYRKVAAEVISTFVLVFLGCGSVIADKKSGGAVTLVGISLVFGLAIMAMIRAVGHISGAHMNPAITIAFASVGDFPLTLVPFYILGQIGGAICAGYVLRLMFDFDFNENVADLGTTRPAHSDLQALGMEFLLTLVLMFVVSSVAVDSKSVGELAALILGLTIALNAIVGGTISGASMNPARSIGPAVAAQSYEGLWIYVVGPILGAVLGAWLYALLHGPNHLPSESSVRIRSHADRQHRFRLVHRVALVEDSVASEGSAV